MPEILIFKAMCDMFLCTDSWQGVSGLEERLDLFDFFTCLDTQTLVVLKGREPGYTGLLLGRRRVEKGGRW